MTGCISRDASDVSGGRAAIARLAKAVGSEEARQARICADIDDVRKDLRDLLADCRDHNTRTVGGGRVHPFRRSRSNAAFPHDLSGGSTPSASSVAYAREGRVASKGSAVSDDSCEVEEEVPLYRPCACGCGEMVLRGFDDQVVPLCASSLSDTACDALDPPADPSAQRALCERLSQPRVARSAGSATPLHKDGEPVAHYSVARMEKLAMPRIRPNEHKIDVQQQITNFTPKASLHRTGNGCVGPPKTQRTPLACSTKEAGGEALPLPPRKVVSSPAAPSDVPKPGSGAPLGLAAASLKLRRNRMRPSIEEFGGLGALLDRAVSMPILAPLPRRPVLSGEPSDVGAPGLEHVPLGSNVDGLQQISKRDVRSAKSQNKYLESRLYRVPPPAPGSTAALQQRLEMLRRERREREAKEQVHQPLHDQARDHVAAPSPSTTAM